MIGRLRSRQSGHPSGPLGRVVGRAMVRDTAAANDRALARLDLTEPRTILNVGFGQGRTAAVLLEAGHRVLGVDSSPTMVRQHHLERVATQATAIGRHDLARTADQLAATAHHTRVICHGDLHPFNLLVDGDQWTLIDWSTAVVADPHYDLAFTTLMLANPPLDGPAPVRAATRAIGTRIADRFLRSYERSTGYGVDPERLEWGRRAHSVRALVEIATWEANHTIEAHRGHPWLTMRQLLEAQLALRSVGEPDRAHVGPRRRRWRR
jgi:Phosphotransferase enzyme family